MTTAFDPLLTLKQVAARLGLTIRSIYRLIAWGELSKPIKVGRRAVRMPESAVNAYLQKRQPKGPPLLENQR